MKAKCKRIGIYIFLSIVILIVASFIFSYYFTRPVQVQHVFQSGISVKDNNIKDNNINIDLNGYIRNADFKLSKLAIRKDLTGTITINEKQYSMNLVNFGSATDNLFWGTLTEIGSSPKSKPSYIAYITSDLSTIYLSQDTEKYHIAAPAKTIDDYNQISHNMNGIKN
jgi:hypothetical protein